MWQSLTSLENLFDAYHAAARGKRKNPDVARFEFNLEENIFNLRAALSEGTYQHGPFHSFYMHDPVVLSLRTPERSDGVRQSRRSPGFWQDYPQISTSHSVKTCEYQTQQQIPGIICGEDKTYLCCDKIREN